VSARDEILARIRAANAASGAGAKAGSTPVASEYAAIPRDYLLAHHDAADTDVVALFAERAADYQAVVERVPAEADVPAAIARAVSAARTLAAPDGLPPQWLSELPHGTMVIGDDSPSSPGAPLSPHELDTLGGVLTGCAVAIAETGTVVLDHGPGQGRRALTLVPDFHLVVVRADQVAADLPDALARLDPRRPVTFISGPSATSDIELIRVEGVHGPRKLHVLIAG
jgi:L-lactate dehydrogenase complex protein LldG